MLTRKAAAALAAGCTVVAHPSAETPYSALALAELSERAGFPAGAFQCRDRRRTSGCRALDGRQGACARSPSPAPPRSEKLLYRQSAETIKRMVLELGGHAPFLLFADANPEQAVEEAIKAKFATSGQDCLGRQPLLRRALRLRGILRELRRSHLETLGRHRHGRSRYRPADEREGGGQAGRACRRCHWLRARVS